MVVASVPAKVSDLFEVSVFPAAIVRVLVPLFVIVNPLTVVNTPVAGVVAPIVILFIVPPVAVSVPAVILFELLDNVSAVLVVAPLPVTEASVSASVDVTVN